MLALDQTKLNATVIRPTRIVCLIGNCREDSDDERLTQDIVLESPDSVIGPGGTVALLPHQASIFHHEALLAPIIGKRVKDLAAHTSALGAPAGCTGAIDASGRGIVRMSPRRIGKSFDTITPLGPAIVKPDEVGDQQNLRATLSVNGEVRQDYTTSNIEHSVVEVLAFISGHVTLVPGNVTMCGTNDPGIGPLHHDDQVHMAIENVGTLEVSVHNVRRCEWPRWGQPQDNGADTRRIRRLIGRGRPKTCAGRARCPPCSLAGSCR